MLVLDNIHVQLGKNHILKGISCHIQKGDFIVIVGANGAGKSTFFDVIAGKLKPTRGTMTLDGTDVTHLTELQRSNMITRIFQNTRLNCVHSMTVAQNLALARYSRCRARLIDGMGVLSHVEAVKLLQNIHMSPEILQKRMDALSGGQRQLIAFTMATQMIPKILLLDEPTAALDPQAATTLLLHAATFIKQHHITTLLITHDPHIALSIGNKIWVLEDGIIAKQFVRDEHMHLDPDTLIGQIDYKALARL